MSEQTLILIVDDEPIGRETLGEMLALDNYDLCFACDGQAALDQTAANPIDLILLDVMMPVMDGFQVCEKIKSDMRWQHIPIILVTALDSKSELKRGFDAGADDFLTKPVNLIELRSRVRSMLRIKRQYDELQDMLALREDMANMIVHDMRIPLTAIRGLSELALLEAQPQEQLTEDMQFIHTSAQRLDALMNDILTLAKMKEGKLVLNQTPVDIMAQLDSVIKNHQTTAKLKDIELKVVCKVPRTNPVQVDAPLFQRLLDNLISNAIKFSEPEGTVTLQIESPEEQNIIENAKFKLSVIDEGIGIAPEDYNRIFEKFNTVDVQEGQVAQLGLGLAFCKLVIDTHQGHISVAANTPQGTIFTVIL